MPTFQLLSPFELKLHKRHLGRYILHSRLAVALSSPLIYIGVIPMLLLDLFLTTFQTACFPIYGIPKVQRGDFFVFDRARLQYLNLLERANCLYCSYANGLFAYAVEIAARTEQHWCPIKHAKQPTSEHSHYHRFFE